MRLEGKVVIVTGSTAGIGEAIARRCVEEGALVVVHGRDLERGHTLVSELGDAAAFHADDLADEAAPARLVHAAVDRFGRLDSVCNNAAWVVRSALADTTAELFDQVMRINVLAPLLTIKAALPHLVAASGSVLNIGSVNGYCGEPTQLAYGISKGALMTMSRNLADALAPDGVRVNHINVGWVLTPNEYELKVKDGLPADWPARLPVEVAPSGRLIESSEIATAAVYWLGDESRPISGTVLELEQYPFLGRNPTKTVQ